MSARSAALSSNRSTESNITAASVPRTFPSSGNKPIDVTRPEQPPAERGALGAILPLPEADGVFSTSGSSDRARKASLRPPTTGHGSPPVRGLEPRGVADVASSLPTARFGRGGSWHRLGRRPIDRGLMASDFSGDGLGET